MKVTIITPTYNAEKTVASCLDSVANQSYDNIEHIIIDGGSTDGTLAVIKDFAHLAKVVSEADEGLYDAMNKGIDNSKGEVIGILNADDRFAYQDVIGDVVDTMTNNDCQLTYGDLTYVDSDGKSVRKWKTGRATASDFLNGWMPPHPTVFVKREVYDRYGKFRLDMGTSADYEFLLRVIYKHRIKMAYIPEVLVHMLQGGVSNASLINRLKANRMDRRAWKVNDLQPRWYTRMIKPLRKLGQWI